MLYDPKWEVEVKADPFSLPSLIAWLETMPADKDYCPGMLNHCLLAQWAQAMGEEDISQRSWDLGNLRPFSVIAAIDGPAHHLRTFGAALERARATLLSR